MEETDRGDGGQQWDEMGHFSTCYHGVFYAHLFKRHPRDAEEFEPFFPSHSFCAVSPVSLT